MSLIVRALLVAAALLAAALPAGAADQPLDVTSVAVDPDRTVRLTVTAPTELAGRELPPGSFTLVEAGKQRSVDIERLPTDDLEVVLLVDTSGSMEGAPIAAARDAAVSFIDQMPAPVRIAVVGFGSGPAVLSEFGADRAAARAAVSGLQASGETALYDAVGAALDRFVPTGQPTRRIVVLLSDGADTVSAAALPDVASRLHDSGVTLYAVELQSADVDHAALEQLASATPGRVVAASDPAALAAVYDGIAAELVSQYELSYSSQLHGPTPLRIELRWPEGLAVAEPVVELPPPAELQIIGVEPGVDGAVEVRVLPPAQLSGEQLGAADFLVEQGDRQVRPDVAAVDPRPLDVVLAVDVSGSMEGAPLAAARAAARGLLADLPDDAAVSLVAFAERATTVEGFTQDRDAISAALDGLEVSGETALHDALGAAADLFAGRPPSARSVILLSDGGDTASSSTLSEAIGRLTAAGVTVHGLALSSPEADASTIGALAERTGGTAGHDLGAPAISALGETLALTAAGHYVLRFDSLADGTSELTVTIERDAIRAADTARLVLPAGPPLVPSFLASRWGLAIGIAALYVALSLVILQILAPSRPGAQLERLAGKARARKGALSDVAERAVQLADRELERHGWSGRLNAALERAGLDLRPGEFVVLVLSGCIAAFACGAILGGPLLAILFVVLAGFVGRLLLSFLGDRRLHKFADQLGDTLQLLAGSLRVGHGLMQAVDSVAREADAPTSQEFRRLVVETRLGRDLDDALAAMAARVGNEDFTWVVQAIEIHREVGGDLAEVLDNVAATIRERNQIRRQVKALSAEGRLSAWILLALPFGVAGFVALTNPTYIAELTRGVGLVMSAVGAVLMVAGGLWLKRIVRLVF